MTATELIAELQSRIVRTRPQQRPIEWAMSTQRLVCAYFRANGHADIATAIEREDDRFYDHCIGE
jgi:hypothetical protein